MQVDVADHGPLRHPRIVSARKLRHDGIQVERHRAHPQLAGRLVLPLGPRPVAVDLDAVALRVAQVERLAHEVVGGAREPRAGTHHSLDRAGQGRTVGDEDREVEEAGRARRRRGRVRIGDQLDQRRVDAHHPVAQRPQPDRTRVVLTQAVRVGHPEPDAADHAALGRRCLTSSRIRSTSPGSSHTCSDETSEGEMLPSASTGSRSQSSRPPQNERPMSTIGK